MERIEEIDRAITAHGQWKNRLRAAIESGATAFPIATIRGDEACEFGMWLFGPTFTDTERRTLDYRKTTELHAHFHNVAGRVAELAVGGNGADAEMLLSRDFELASEKLVAAMLVWKENIKAAIDAARRQ